MRQVGTGILSAGVLNSLHSLKEIKIDYLPKETRDSLDCGWEADNPAKVYIARGRSSELLEGRHRSSYFVNTNRPDYMVPVVFYTDD